MFPSPGWDSVPAAPLFHILFAVDYVPEITELQVDSGLKG